MSVTTVTRSVAYTGNGVAHTFAIGFPYMDSADLAISINGAALVLGVDYEVLGTYPSQSIHFIYWPAGVKTDNPPVNGAAVLIQRVTPVLQPTNYLAQGQFFPATHESSFDRATMQIQDLGATANIIITLNANLIYDLHTYYADVPADGTVIGRWVLARAVTYATNLAGSRGASKVAATGSTVFSIKRNGVQVATCTFAAGATTCTFLGTAFSLAIGDVLSIDAPTPADLTLESISIVLAGQRVI